MSEALTFDQRQAIAMAMDDHGLNKCADCCLVPDCDTCGGPYDCHDDATEARAALRWADMVALP